MKHFLLISIFTFIIANAALAQSWSCLYPNDTVYYLDVQGNHLGLTAIDSTASGSELHYKIFRTAKFDASCSPSNDDGINTNSLVWAGAEIHKLPNGDYRFYNQHGDTLTIQSKAALGDRWLFYRTPANDSIMARVTHMDTATVMGVIDSIKTIQLQANTTSDTSISQWDGMELVLSQSHGLVAIPEILPFPVKGGLVSITPTQPLTYGEVYNYQIGDYFQVQKTVSRVGGVTTTVTYKAVLDKTISNGGNTVAYTFHRETQTSWNGIAPSFITDTVIETHHNLQSYIGSALPFKVEETGDTSRPLTVSNMAIYSANDFGLMNRRTTQVLPYIPYMQLNDTCWQWTNLAIDANEPPVYFECLGLLYRNSSGLDALTNEDLVYYNLCGEMGGSKLVLGVNELPEAQVKLYPNPASHTLEINNTGNNHYTAHLVNLQGQVQRTISIEPNANATIDVSQLAPGLYIVQFNDGNNSYFKKVSVNR